MKRVTTIPLKITIFIIGLVVLALCVWLPDLAKDAAELNPEYAYLRYPVLLGLYISAIPFYYALYQALLLLRYIEHENAFSDISVASLKQIKICAISISLLFILGSVILAALHALHPGIALIGFAIIFAAFVVAVFSALLQGVLSNALDLKSENDLTV